MTTHPHASLTLLDGGMGRLLEQLGAPFRQPEWSALALMEAPDFVTRAHRAFIEAGADVITTNTYAIIPFHIGQDRFDAEGRALIRLAAQLARQAADESPRLIKVAGCLPPVFGSYRPDLFDAGSAAALYRPLIEEQAPFVDFWLAETISSLAEARCAVQAAAGTDKPFWLSYTLLDRDDPAAEAPQLRSGETLQQAAAEALALGVDALLFNCSQMEEMMPALGILSAGQPDIPFGVYANAFPAIKKTQQANDEILRIRDEISPEKYREAAQGWLDAGCTIIGGCCGIGPDHIRALAELKR